MQLTDKHIEDVIFRIASDDGLALLKLLKDKSNVSEFDIATKLKEDIKKVRRTLYFLYNKNLVSFTRKKDKQKGWYIYYWTLEKDAIRFEFIKGKRQTLQRLEENLVKEQKELFYVCQDQCVRLDMNESLEYDFHCPECGELLEQDQNAQKIERLTKRIATLKEEIAEIEASEKIRLEKAAAIAKKEREKEAAEAKAASDAKRRETLRKKKEAKLAAEAKKAEAKEKKAATKKAKTTKKKVAKKATKAKSTKLSEGKSQERSSTRSKTTKKKATKKKTATKKKAVKKKAATKKKEVKKKTTTKKKVVAKKK